MGSFLVNVGWNVEWNKDKFYNSDNRHTKKVLHKMIKDQKGSMKVLSKQSVQIFLQEMKLTFFYKNITYKTLR